MTNDPLVAELRQRRAAAIAEARRVAGKRGDMTASLFMNLYAAQQCDQYLELLSRIDDQAVGT
jgi:hypothetical protein